MIDYKTLIPELRAAMNVSQKDFAKILGVANVSLSEIKRKKLVEMIDKL